tara:strand:+ start:374 stop:1387 length:1014 start_codon:yes stop_codon:yes gene_type:complete
MSFSIGNNLHFVVPDGNDDDAKRLAHRVVAEVTQPQQQPPDETILERLQAFVRPVTPAAAAPQGKKIAPGEKIAPEQADRFRNYTAQEYAGFLKDFAIYTIQHGHEKLYELALCYVVRPVDKDVAKELVKIVATHFKLQEGFRNLLAQKVVTTCVDDWKEAAKEAAIRAEEARALRMTLTMGQIRKTIKSALSKKSNGCFPEEEVNRLKNLTVDQFASRVANLAIAPVLSKLCNVRVQGIKKIEQHLGLYQTVRPDLFRDATGVVDLVIKNVVKDKLLAKWNIVDDGAGTSGSGEKRTEAQMAGSSTSSGSSGKDKVPRLEAKAPPEANTSPAPPEA